MKITPKPLIQKYSLLIFFSFLLLNCTNKKAVQDRRYLISNAKQLGLIKSAYVNSETEEQAIYHKIFKNYQGSSTYKIKTTPKNNPSSHKIKKSNVSQKIIPKANNNLPIEAPKSIELEKEPIINSSPNNQDNKISSEILSSIPKPDITMPEIYNNQDKQAEAGKQDIPTTPDINQETSEAGKVDHSVTILPPLSLLFENAENTDFLEEADKIIAQNIKENNILNDLDNTKTQDQNLDTNDEILEQKPINQITSLNNNVNSLNEPQPFKISSLDQQNSAFFTKKYYVLDSTLLFNNFTQLATYAHLS